MAINSPQEYIDICKRLDKGLIEINKAGGFFKAPQSWVDEYQRLAEETLEYEIENDLIPELL